MNSIVFVNFECNESTKVVAQKIWQYDYGQILRIQGLNLPAAVEIHFSLQKTGGAAKRRIGVTRDGVTDVVIPDFILTGEGIERNYSAYAFVYLSDEESGHTEHRIELNITSRPEPEGSSKEEDTSFGAIMDAVNKIAEQNGQGVSDEKIQEAVNAYMEANPVEGNVTVDTDLSETSTNPVQNKVVTAKFSQLQDTIANLGRGTYSSIEPAEDDIPKVFFGKALQQTKDEIPVSFRYISKTQDISGYAKIKAQGNSSMSYPKKNQTVKLYKDVDCTEKLKVDFKGWGEQQKFCFKANWIDLTHARNVVSARIWADIVKSRANFAELPELYRTSPNIGAVDGFPVKVYAAGVYQGRYTLNIPKDAWMANMDDELDEHCILCGEGYVSGCFREASMGQWTDEVHDSCPTVISTRWKEFINFVMNSTDDEFKAGLSDYFYVDSLIDCHLYNLENCGLDAYGKNQLYMTYDGQKWIACMYDMDSTWGLYFNGASFVSTDYDRSEYQDFKDGEGNLLFIRLEKLFYEELQARWSELKNGALSMTNITNRFERFTDIAPAELVAEDYASTTGGGSFTEIPSQSTNNIQQIRAFALARQEWTDAYISGLRPPVACTGITLSATELTFDGTGSQTLIATVTPEDTTDSIVWSSDNNGVATVSDGVVTAWSNGNAVITATCGNYSATCAVQVGNMSSIDYTLNPLDGIEWESGYKYDNSGVKVAVANENCTPKFEVQPCTYQLKGGSYSAMYVWDENDNFVGSIQLEENVCVPAGYKIALKSYGVDFDPTAVSFMPVDNSETAVYTEIDLASLTWTAKSFALEATLPSAVAVDIDSSNYACFHSAGYGAFPSGISVIGFALHETDNGYATITCGGFGTDNDAAMAYFTENGTKLLLNERYK